MLAVNKNLFQALESALKASNFYQDPERKDLAVQAVLLSHHLSDLQRAQLESPDLETIDQTRTLLENFLERCGNPNVNPVIKRLAKVDSRLSILKGSVRDDGRISDFYLTGPGSQSKVRHVTSDVDAVLEAYYVNCRGVTLEETLKQFTDQAAIATLGDSPLDTLRDRLLASDEVFWNNKLFYPATQFYQGRNGFDLIDFFEAQAIDLGEDSPFTAKLRRQCQIMREQMKLRPLEEIPINLFACAKGGWLDLEILNKFERMEKIGKLYYRPNGRVDIEVRMSYRDAREPEYLVNFINGEKLTYDPDSETGFLGTNSKEGKDWLSAFTADFHDWLLVSEYRSLVEESYNRRFNGYIQKQYSDEPFPIAKFTPPPGVKPHGYQWQDVRQFLAQGRGLLGWGVGLGKTLAAIMLVLALKQYGYCDKPAIVVPKSLIGNWKREIDRWTTGVNYLIIGLTQVFYEDGTPVRCVPGYEVIHDSQTRLPQISAAGNYLLKVKRQKEIVEMDPVEFERRSELQFCEDSLDEKLRKIYLVATNDYDIVLMWRETWKSIPLSAARELSYLEDLIGRHLSKDERKSYFGDAKNKETIGGRRAKLRHKARQEAREQAKRDYKEQETRAKIGARLNEQRGKKLSTREIFFELSRIDCVLLDEAHAMSNLWTPQGIHATTKGASVQPSQRSYDFYQKSRYIKELHNGKMVYLLTATPVKNSPLDLYSLLQYIADEEFLLRGIRTVDEFLDTFGKVADLTAPTLDGQVRTDRALIGFRLLPELQALVNKYAIIRDSKNAGINEPKEYRIEHVIEMIPEQSYLYALLTDRMEQGLELRRTREWDLLSACPELEPFSVLADMDKLTLSPQHYLTSTVYGAGLDNLEDIAYSLANNAYELVGPIHNYRLQFDETLERLTDREAAERKIPIHHTTRKLQIGDTVTDQPDFSDEYKALVQELRGSDRVQQEIGSLAQYSEKHFGWRCEAGCRREILNVMYELHQENGIYKWQWVAGYPYHSDEMYELIRGVLEADKAVAAARRELSDWQRTKEQTDNVKRMIKAAQKRVKQAYKQATAARLNCQVQPGSQITHQDVEFVLNDNHRWERLDGEPMYDDRSPKFDRLVQEAVMYYHAGCIKVMRLDTGGYFTTTPHGLFTKPDGSADIETCLANWRTIKVGDEYEVKLGDDLVKSVVVQIGGSNQIIFCDQVGASKKDKSARLFTRLRDQLEAAGIPPIEVEFVYGSVSPQTRQAIVQRFAAGVCRIVIGPTVCMGEGSAGQCLSLHCPLPPNFLVDGQCDHSAQRPVHPSGQFCGSRGYALSAHRWHNRPVQALCN